MTSLYRYLLPLLTCLSLAAPALAADVTVELDAASGFVIQNNGASVERLSVDEATGNVSRNGALFVHTTGTNNTFIGEGAGNTATHTNRSRESAQLAAPPVAAQRGAAAGVAQRFPIGVW